MEHKFEITETNAEQFTRALKITGFLFSGNLHVQILNAKITEDTLTVQINKPGVDTIKDLILPFPDEYDGTLNGNEFILQMDSKKHVDAPPYPPKTIIFKYADGSHLDFIIFKRMKFS